jgi:uncharacterized protein (TIGR02231 family)
VIYSAEVTQRTGESWNDTALTLSTARPALKMKVPELTPWYVGRPAPPPEPELAFAMTVRSASAEAVRGGERGGGSTKTGAALTAAAVEEATVEVSGSTVTYKIASRADIAGNGLKRKVQIGSFRWRPQIGLITSPKLAALCYRHIQVKNDSRFTLLACKAQIFDGDDFLGTIDLELLAPGQETEFVLGIDDRIVVERELYLREAEKVFLKGDRRRIRYGYLLTFRNLHAEIRKIKVLDQLPLGADEQIMVKVEEIEPKGFSRDEMNLLEWKLELPPGGEQKIRFVYSVECPSDRPLP